MDNREKFEFIKEKLSENTEEMPASLKKENVMASLENIGESKTRNNFGTKRFISLAASVAVVIVSVIMVGAYLMPKLGTKGVENEVLPETSDVTVTSHKPTQANTEAAFENTDENQSEGTTTAQSADEDYSDIIEYFKKLGGNITYSGNSGMPETPTMSATTVWEESVVISKGDSFYNAAGAVDKNSSYDAPHGETNTQVDNVDEADIIKNDGTYIYVALDSCVRIYRADGLSLMAKLEPVAEDDEDIRIADIYVSGDRLVILASAYQNSEYSLTKSAGTGTTAVYSDAYIGYGCMPYRNYKTELRCLIYDISNVKKPRLCFTHTQDGAYTDSRLVGDVLYTISSYSTYNRFTEDESVIAENCIPKVDGKKISRNKIDFRKDEAYKSYTVISSCNIRKDSQNGAGYAFFGYSGDSYCTENTLYLATTEYLEENEAKKLGLNEGENTKVYCVSLTESDISFKNETYIAGEFINQFAMDEYNGYFRCATTEYTPDWEAVSCVRVLDGDLKEISCIRDLAENESVKAVRFMGDIAYVITFENTDPLFIIDLSDPKNPKKLGEVKLPGFSAYLHPTDENHILGVGYGGDDDGIDDSLQVTLFDISDKAHPVVSDKYIIREASTEVDYNAKAFLSYTEKNLVCIPVTKSEDRKDGYEIDREYVLINTENGKLSLYKTFKHDKTICKYYVDKTIYDGVSYNNSEYDYPPEFFRGTYIGDRVYTISERKLCEFDLNSGELLSKAENGR